ncbi:methyltransferase domain-containing protein [Providencia rettgeri]|uniref:methyltransferase domain-containing protein n=1 Tax=Providencia rettgeri TaxID=587 RepID=UPI003D769E3A
MIYKYLFSKTDTVSIDIVFERALIHHTNDYNSNYNEIHRILNDYGYFIIQDRSLEMLPYRVENNTYVVSSLNAFQTD